MIDIANDLTLYLLVRTDLPSMGPGKRAAHAAHAANQFIYQSRSRFGSTDWDSSAIHMWETQADGFGTTVTLAATGDDIHRVVGTARSEKFASSLTYDPTYPFVVDAEICGLLDRSKVTFAPIKEINSAQILCYRHELTAGYVFGSKAALVPILGHLPLLP